MAQIVISHDGLSPVDGPAPRGVIDVVALPEHAERGWAQVGPWCGIPGSVLTDAEWAAEQAPPVAPPKKQPTTKKEGI